MTATDFAASSRTVSLADGQTLSYDGLVLAPGIDISWDALPGYNLCIMAKLLVKAKRRNSTR